eukprot:g9149.t1
MTTCAELDILTLRLLQREDGWKPRQRGGRGALMIAVSDINDVFDGRWQWVPIRHDTFGEDFDSQKSIHPSGGQAGVLGRGGGGAGCQLEALLRISVADIAPLRPYRPQIILSTGGRPPDNRLLPRHKSEQLSGSLPDEDTRVAEPPPCDGAATSALEAWTRSPGNGCAQAIAVVPSQGTNSSEWAAAQPKRGTTSAGKVENTAGYPSQTGPGVLGLEVLAIHGQRLRVRPPTIREEDSNLRGSMGASTTTPPPSCWNNPSCGGGDGWDGAYERTYPNDFNQTKDWQKQWGEGERDIAVLRVEVRLSIFRASTSSDCAQLGGSSQAEDNNANIGDGSKGRRFSSSSKRPHLAESNLRRARGSGIADGYSSDSSRQSTETDDAVVALRRAGGCDLPQSLQGAGLLFVSFRVQWTGDGTPPTLEQAFSRAKLVLFSSWTQPFTPSRGNTLQLHRQPPAEGVLAKTADSSYAPPTESPRTSDAANICMERMPTIFDASEAIWALKAIFYAIDHGNVGFVPVEDILSALSGEEWPQGTSASLQFTKPTRNAVITSEAHANGDAETLLNRLGRLGVGVRHRGGRCDHADYQDDSSRLMHYIRHLLVPPGSKGDDEFVSWEVWAALSELIVCRSRPALAPRRAFGKEHQRVLALEERAFEAEGLLLQREKIRIREEAWAR